LATKSPEKVPSCVRAMFQDGCDSQPRVSDVPNLRNSCQCPGHWCLEYGPVPGAPSMV
jgi:hypothetical protein